MKKCLERWLGGNRGIVRMLLYMHTCTCKGSHLFVNAVDDKYMYMYMYCMVLYYRSHGHMQGEREEVCGYWNAVPPIYTHI